MMIGLLVEEKDASEAIKVTGCRFLLVFMGKKKKKIRSRRLGS